MKNSRRHIFLAVGFAVCAVLLFAWAQGASKNPETRPEENSLTIVTRSGRTHVFSIEVPQTPQQMAQGLMFRRSLAPDAGMLFVFSHMQVISMWMKNTLIPLDMLFMDRSGVIVDIRAMTQPLSENLITPDAPAMAVLELAGGTAARLGIEKGDRAVHSAFDAAP